LQEFERINIPEDVKDNMIQFLKNEEYLDAYKTRLERLIYISKFNEIEPIFITQPALYGNAIDDTTNVDLGKIKIGDTDGDFHWKRLELLNDVTRRVGEIENLLVIDLAKEMPKNSKYYYDFLHFTNYGAEKVAEILYNKLCPYLKKKFVENATSNCKVSSR
jgi:hypothetical protein